MNRLRRVLIVAAAVALVACGGDPGSDAGPGSGGSGPADTAGTSAVTSETAASDVDTTTTPSDTPPDRPVDTSSDVTASDVTSSDVTSSDVTSSGDRPDPTSTAGDTTPRPTSPDTAPAPTLPTDPLPTRPTEPPGDTDVEVVEWVEVANPVAFATRGADVYVADQSGKVVLVREGAAIEPPAIDITDDVDYGGEKGLLGVAVHPDQPLVYVSYTNTSGDNQLDEFVIGDDGRFVASTRRTVFTYDHPDEHGNHNGGHVIFGPDGLLYMALGDGGGAGDPERSGQDLDTLLGKIIRIDPTTPSGELGYAIPADNPFAAGGGRAEIWSYGLRNAWKFSFDRATGDLWIADVGQGQLEEVNLADSSITFGAGANFGWSAFEASERFNDDVEEPANHTPPVYEYEHEKDNNSITGGYVYRGTAIPNLVGAYVFGDYASGRVWALWLDGDDATVRELATVKGLASFGEDVNGELYALSLEDGAVYRLVPD